MSWVRLWHDMPTDPKWRSIARKSGQPLACVIAVFNFVMINASTNAADRGSLSGWDNEDVASALDMSAADVEAIVSAMQGKVLDGSRLTGWEKKQPLREDNDFRRTPEWRVIRQEIFARDNYTCAYCGAHGVSLQCDHVVPVSRGGGHDSSNLVTACSRCNQSKRDKLLSEWRQ